MNVAIVDDDASLCRAVGRLLRQAGWHPYTFLSAEEFLAAPQRPTFGCLLLDVQLGGMSGPELHRRMLAQGDRTPVIYLSAQDDPAAEAAGKRIGCAGFFRKSDPGARILDRLHSIEQNGLARRS